MHLLTCENITKSYSLVKLFNQINLSIDSTDKIGLIGINGTGKSTLLKIISGLEQADEGNIITMRHLRINYMAQEQNFQDEHTVLEQIFDNQTEEMQVIKAYEHASIQLEKTPDHPEIQATFNQLSELMAIKQLYDLEFQVKSILHSLGITDFDAKIKTLSGGQKKRIALAEALVTPCDLLILDEPTNHLDSQTILWLENYLKNRNGALLMITHDRYFLDRIVNKTIELSGGALYEYQGNYEYFIAKKAERLALEASTQLKRQNMYRRELAWMRAGAQARSTKSKSRIQRFHLLEEQLKTDATLELVMETGYTRLGNKVIEMKDVSMAFDNQQLFQSFEYHFTAEDRIGIVGSNGSGKTTLLNLISGKLTPTSGIIDIGSTVKMGYFTQDFDEFSHPEQRAIEYIRDIAEFVVTPSGYKISASELMETFLFPSELQWTPIEKLSGGERRRLQLLGILISAPNVLLLDEPTNNLDLDTLKVFEQYLDDFKGVILCVSHDRYFLDRTCDKLLAFESGTIELIVQSYSDYLEKWLQSASVQNQMSKSKPTANEKTETKTDRKIRKEKLSYQETKALENLPAEIEKIELRLEALEQEFTQFATDFGKLTQLSSEKDALEMLLLEKMELLETLKEKAEALRTSI